MWTCANKKRLLCMQLLQQSHSESLKVCRAYMGGQAGAPYRAANAEGGPPGVAAGHEPRYLPTLLQSLYFIFVPQTSQRLLACIDNPHPSMW